MRAGSYNLIFERGRERVITRCAARKSARVGIDRYHFVYTRHGFGLVYIGMRWHRVIFALLGPASAPLAAKIQIAYFGINTAGSNVNLMRP